MELAELAKMPDMNWEKAEETAVGLGKKLIDIVDKSNSKREQNLRERKQIWQQAIQMCEDDKESFKTELIQTQQTIKLMTTPVKFSAETRATARESKT